MTSCISWRRHAVGGWAVIVVHVDGPARANMAEPDQMAHFMEVCPELYGRVRDHGVRLDVVLAVENRVRAKIHAILHANDGNRIVGVGGLWRRLEIELAIDIAPVGRTAMS